MGLWENFQHLTNQPPPAKPEFPELGEQAEFTELLLSMQEGLLSVVALVKGHKEALVEAGFSSMAAEMMCVSLYHSFVALAFSGRGQE